MFKYKTVFVIGAGASHEFGLPLGGQLAATIGKKCDIWFDSGEQSRGDKKLWQALQMHSPHELREYQQAAWRIRDGIVLKRSIDDFLDSHEADERVKLLGKATIVQSILEAERISALRLKGEPGQWHMDFSAALDTWIVKFMRLLSAGVAIANADKMFENVSFIVFNYDRCLEHFLGQAMPHMCDGEDHAAQIVSRAKIFHPYGSISNLTGADAIEFGSGAFGPKHIDVARNIRTYTERVADEDVMKTMHEEIASCEQLIFLGFGFHHQSMKLLTPDHLYAAKRIIATAHGISDEDCLVVRERIAAMFRPDQQHIVADNRRTRIRNDLNCSKLFDEYALTLQSS